MAALVTAVTGFGGSKLVEVSQARGFASPSAIYGAASSHPGREGIKPMLLLGSFEEAARADRGSATGSARRR